MRKEELRKLRALPATREMMEKGKQTKKVKDTRWNGKTWAPVIVDAAVYDVLFRVQNLSGIIKIAAFFPEDVKKDIKTPRYEIFLNEIGGEYLTRELDEKGNEKRWLTSMLENLPDMPSFSWYRSIKYYITRDGMQTLNRLKLEDGKEKKRGPYRLREWQQEQKDAKTKRLEEKEQAPWDADMALIPELPKTFEEWMRKDVANAYYIFYEYDRKGAKTGYCSRCKRIVPISGAKHGKETKCPACGVKATFRSHSRIQTLTTGEYYGEIIQRFKGGIVVRKFEQKQWYRDRPYDDPSIMTHEYERIMMFDDGTTKCYAWGSYKNKYNRWCLDKTWYPTRTTYYWQTRIKLYKRNLAQLKKTSLLKQSAIDLWPELPTSTTNYLAIERGNPAVEMLAKMGMFRLAKDFIKESYERKLLDQNQTEIAKMLKVDKSRMKRLKDMDANIYHLKWMQYEKTANTIWPDEMIRDFGEAKILSSDFGFLNVPISFVKCHNYLKKQAALMDETMHQALITWEDYIDMADSMKMDTKNDQIARPKDLKRAHDELILIKETEGLEKQAKQIEKKWPKVNKQLKKLKKFEYTFGDYTIVAPESVLDIVKEGTILRHCVHTCDYYFSRITDDESYLFFLRKSKQPDMPWYTLEVEPSGNIRQKRTTGDNQNADFQKAVGFLKKWQQFFKKQLTAEEKELGEKANKLRLENYANLRKNGNKVWHGKLAGQLLADVLEKDFMEAM
ncbi:MAG: PcfJ domain-containing protein [Lachnospiraceae bacterium]